MMLPASEITDGVAENLHLALRRYCESRLTLVQRETQVAWRQGLRSLGGRRPFTVKRPPAVRQGLVKGGALRPMAHGSGRPLDQLAAVATLAWPQVTLSPWPRHT